MVDALIGKYFFCDASADNHFGFLYGRHRYPALKGLLPLYELI